MKKKSTNIPKPGVFTKKVHVKGVDLYKLYILMRNDLASMNPGKAMAQAAHAANQFISDYGEKPEVQFEWCGDNPHRQCKRPFGTTIVLSVTGMELETILEGAFQMKVPCGEIWDETYPYSTTLEISNLIPVSTHTAPPIYKENGQVVLFRNELTCGYVFVVDGSSEQEELVGALPLHP